MLEIEGIIEKVFEKVMAFSVRKSMGGGKTGERSFTPPSHEKQTKFMGIKINNCSLAPRDGKFSLHLFDQNVMDGKIEPFSGAKRAGVSPSSTLYCISH